MAALLRRFVGRLLLVLTVPLREWRPTNIKAALANALNLSDVPTLQG